MAPDIAATVEKLAAFADASETDVLHSLLAFALNNRNWLTLGLYGRRLTGAPYRPRAKVESKEKDDA